MKRYYLDHNATTPLDERVRVVMEPYQRGLVGNPSSLHAEGRRARGAVDIARDQVAALLGAKPSEIIFTSGGTESCNLAVQGLALAHRARGQHVIVSAGEHHAVLHAAQALQQRHGFDVTFLPLQPDGRTDPDELRRALRDDTVLVSVMTANNETGVKSPVTAIGEICADRSILFHTDAVQSAGKEPLRAQAWHVSALSLTAHKFGGPHGAGLLYLHAGIPVARLMEGGAHENERRPGTENVAAIVGLAKALEFATAESDAHNAAAFALTEQLWQELAPLAPIRRNGHPTERLGNTLNVSFPDLHPEEFLIALDLAGLSVSSGSACLVGSVQTSHVLQAMGNATLHPVEGRETTRGTDVMPATVRFSIGHDLSPADITEIATRVRTVVSHQRPA